MHQIDLCLLLIPALPLAAAVLVALLGAKVLRGQSHFVVIAALGMSFVCSLGLLNGVYNGQQTAENEAQAKKEVSQADPKDVVKYEATRRDLHRAGYERVITLWTWVNVPQAYEYLQPQSQPPIGEPDLAISDSGPRDFNIPVALRADGLTAMMLAMVTFVSTLVAIFAAGYMHGDRGYWRFFAYIALFVFSMTMLVSVSNFLLLFVFWEAVGVCSYLLVGFWYEKPEAAAAGKKAFLVNRVGDFGFALALFLIWTNYGSLSFHDSLSDGSVDPAAVQTAFETEIAPQVADFNENAPTIVRGVLGRSRILANEYYTGPVATAICLLLLLGACGKSAQFPLHVWLPDAMEGPTPVSALIHAATMVTAGVYMVARCTPLFMASPDAQLVVAVIGAFTALLAGLIALTQYDLKRVLAYSTISQLGYMFLGLGVGTFAGITSGMFHLFTHAFFKALLFLGAGSVMHAMHHIIDMRRFGGLRRALPYTHGTFLVGCLALAGVFPLAGFWSKDAIVASVHDKAHELQHAGEDHTHHAIAEESPAKFSLLSPETAQRYGQIYQWLYYVSLFTAFLTAFYTFRAYFMTFHGEEVIPPEVHGHAHESPPAMIGPLVVLASCAALVGIVFMYSGLTANHLVDFIGHAPSLHGGAVAATIEPGKFHLDVAALSTVIAVGGILCAMYLYMGERTEAAKLQQAFDLQGTRRYSDVQWVASLKQVPGVARMDRGLRSVGLGVVVSIVGFVLGVIALILALPLTIGTLLSPYRLSSGKFFFDELYNWGVVKPLEVFAGVLAWLDRYLVDGIVNLFGAVPRWLGAGFRNLQMGLVQFYALAMLLGLVVLLLASGVLWAAK
jgi:NADH-quinone oxidoreductase subunit L